MVAIHSSMKLVVQFTLLSQLLQINKLRKTANGEQFIITISLINEGLPENILCNDFH